LDFVKIKVVFIMHFKQKYTFEKNLLCLIVQHCSHIFVLEERDGGELRLPSLFKYQLGLEMGKNFQVSTREGT